MKNEEQRFWLTPEQAESVLLPGNTVHTFRNPRLILIGCDCSRESILEKFQQHSKDIEIGGPSCKNMGHGLVVWTDDSNPLFVECDTEKLEALEKSLTHESTIKD